MKAGINMSMSKKLISVMTAAAIILSFCGCSKTEQNSETTTVTTAESTTQSTEKTDDEMFTDRDYRNSYDESTAVKITLSGDKIECSSDSVEISESNAVIKQEGTYILSGKLSDGQITVEAEDTAKLQLVLDNANINCDTSAAIYVKNADKVFITLADGTENALSNKKDFVSTDDNNIDGVIFSKSNLTVNGTGELTVNAVYGNGIVSKGDLKITSGSCTVDAANHTLQGKDSIRIAGGTLNLTAAEDCLHSKNSDDDSNDKGFVYILGGTLNISAGDDGIHADKGLTVKGGTININKSNEGLEGETINISGGDITVKSSDDGINASGGSSDTDTAGMEDPFSADENCSIIISGGVLKVDADGDGIDSNGSLKVTGGETYVEGPTNGGNGALDYNGTAVIDGGIFVAIGSVGMAQNFSDSSSQGAMLVNISGSAGDKIVLTGSDGTEILSYAANKTYSCAVISCPEITAGETYTVTSGNQSTEVEMSSTIYGNDAMGMGQGNPMDNGNMGKNPMGGGRMGKPQ